jgi:hypothetical protein
MPEDFRPAPEDRFDWSKLTDAGHAEVAVANDIYVNDSWNPQVDLGRSEVARILARASLAASHHAELLAIRAAGNAVVTQLTTRYYCPVCGKAGGGHKGPCPLLALAYLVQHYDEVTS